MEPVVGDVVDVRVLKTRLQDAVRRAGTGTARFETDESRVVARFAAGDDGAATIRLEDHPCDGRVVLVRGRTAYEGWRGLPGFWDPVELLQAWVAGDPMALVASLPDGEARVVERHAGATTYLIRMPEAPLLEFCAQPSDDDEEAGTGARRVEAEWTVGDDDLPVLVRSAVLPGAVGFGDWEGTEPVTLPPAPKAWPRPEPPGPGMLEVHTLAMRLAPLVARVGELSSAVFVVACHPQDTDGSSATRTVVGRFWVVRPDEQWECLDEHRLVSTNTVTEVLARAPLTVSGREPNFLICHFIPAADGGVRSRYGWTTHPDLQTPQAPGRLADPAWVRRALVDVGMTPA